MTSLGGGCVILRVEVADGYYPTMNHDDHVELLRAGVLRGSATWADLGSGTGAFTLALADLLGPRAEIYSVDRDGRALRQQERALREWFPETRVHYVEADFTRRLELPELDGVVIANALHFVPDPRKDEVLDLVLGYLKPGGRLLVVEYGTDRGNQWVPHPFSYRTWHDIAWRNGFAGTRLLASRPSRFLGEIYAAVSERPGNVVERSGQLDP